MRITIITIGTRGDVQPYVALGLGLQAAGHDVCVATHLPFESFIRDYGLQFFPIRGDPSQMLRSKTGHDLTESGSNVVRFFRALQTIGGPLTAAILTDVWNACQRADSVIYSSLGVMCFRIPEILGVPGVGAFLNPLSRTRTVPIYPVTRKIYRSGTFNWGSYIVGEQLVWQSFRPFVNKWLRDYLGLPPAPFLGPQWKASLRGDPILYGFSPSVVPRPPDWHKWLAVTGYWFLGHHPDWRPPDALADFLNNGTKPIYVGFGSMSAREPEGLTRMLLSALRRTGQRAVIATGWGGLSRADLPKEVFAVDAIPHDWLFPRMAGVVHHGGQGTTAASLRAGIPTAIIPFMGDQPFWGSRVAALGVGPPPIPCQHLTEHQLTEKIKIITSNDGIRTRALDLGAKIRQENGAAAAVEAFELAHARLKSLMR